MATQEPRNRAERRAWAKIQKKQMKQIQEYIKRHPEALQVDLDEETIKEADISDKDEVFIGGNFVENIDNIASNWKDLKKKDQSELVSQLVGKKEEEQK